MKLLDAIRRVKRPESRGRWDNAMNVDRVCSALGIQEMWQYPDELDHRLKEYPIFNWLCTDEMVGLYAIYLDGEPVGAYYRSGRKMDYQFMWLSQEIGAQVRSVLLSYLEPETFDVIDPDTQIESFQYLGDTDGKLNVEPSDG